MTADDKLRELLRTGPAMPNTEQLVRWWKTTKELVPLVLAECDDWASAGQKVVDLFDPMKAGASPLLLEMVAKTVKEANAHLREKVTTLRSDLDHARAELRREQDARADLRVELDKLKGEKPAPDEFYILSLKWTRRSELITWWAPDNNGYTTCLDQAGRYPRAKVEAMQGYYNNGTSTIAVPCEQVDAVATRTVFDLHLRRLTGKNFERIIDGASDDECESCGYSAPGVDVGLKVIGDAEPQKEQASG